MAKFALFVTGLALWAAFYWALGGVTIHNAGAALLAMFACAVNEARRGLP